MLKKFLLTSAVILSASTASFAMADNIYVGAGLGGTGFFTHVTERGTPSGEFDDGKLGWIGNLYAGYLFNVQNHFNVGVEGFFNPASVKTSETVGATGDNTTTKYRYSFGLHVLPAYQVTDSTDLHLILGYGFGRFTLQDTGNNVDKTFGSNGYQLGLGSSVHLAKSLLLRGDVIYSNFGENSITAASGTNFKNSLSTFDGIVSLAYLFG